MSRTTTAHYYEHYPHYMGTMNNDFNFDIEEVDELYELMKKEDKDDAAEETWYEKMTEYTENIGYAFADILREWPAIRRTLENKGEWSGQWEEGSHAISMTNLPQARALVGKIEAEVLLECGDW